MMTYHQNVIRRFDHYKDSKGLNYTSACLLLGEFVDKNGDPNGMDSLGSDEKVVVLVYNDPEEDEDRHCRNHTKKRLYLRWLPANPRHHGLNRTLLRLHLFRSLSLYWLWWYEYCVIITNFVFVFNGECMFLWRNHTIRPCLSRRRHVGEGREKLLGERLIVSVFCKRPNLLRLSFSFASTYSILITLEPVWFIPNSSPYHTSVRFK